MSSISDSVGDTFPLATRSRNRRRALIYSHYGQNSVSPNGAADAVLPASTREGDSSERLLLVTGEGEAPDTPYSYADARRLNRDVPGADESNIVGWADFHAIRQWLKEDRSITWVFTGEGATQGGQQTQGMRSYSEHFAQRVRGELGRCLDVVVNTAVTNERSAGLLKNLHYRALQFNPDVVSVMVGVNDAIADKQNQRQFADNLRQIIARIRDAGAVVLLHTPNKIDPWHSVVHARMRGCVKMIRTVARQLDVPCVDHWAYWKKSEPAGDNFRNWLAEDGLHPAGSGQQAMANLIFHRLGISERMSLIRAGTSS